MQMNANCIIDQEHVKVRLINSWNDVTWEKINIVVCNFLYDRRGEHYRTWKELERIAGIRREHLFYGICFAIFVAILRQNPLVVIHSVVVSSSKKAKCEMYNRGAEQ
ncbi:hypothetical protein TELCIR_16041 [Teladorsagia circumcincta]|uniref:Uncharacterized protein n=1 Tax=Teladorsagia circumcincta TaxID=45464 RepID=A0A2G9TWK1_TELCI|nr:hypothetical protein TELCIR_16041 [Teladorsagia circumcincta]